ncbi:MAG: archease [Candidatus Woesearchaeota archaeon]|nr:archease [Candidatus Woesearchaeota archaeon]
MTTEKSEKFRFLKHTADAKIQAYGKNIEEAFSNAALAMFSIMVNTKSIEPKITKKIKVNGNDKNALLYNFLEELLFLLDSEGFLLNRVKKIKISENSLEAEVTGDTASEKYECHGEVKAVTYNDMEIKETKEKTTVQVVFDL